MCVSINTHMYTTYTHTHILYIFPGSKALRERAKEQTVGGKKAPIIRVSFQAAPLMGDVKTENVNKDKGVCLPKGTSKNVRKRRHA